LEWVEARDGAPGFLLWVHFFDVHNTNRKARPPADLIRAMRQDSKQRGEELRSLLVNAHGIPPESLAKEEKRAEGMGDLDRFDRYDAQIASVDRQLRRFFEELESSTPDSRTLWVVTSDHGEGLGNHHYGGHGKYLYGEQIHVPLIFYGGDGGIAPGTVEERVRHVPSLRALT
jgi:arylsulfatase A-like enzyme